MGEGCVPKSGCLALSECTPMSPVESKLKLRNTPKLVFLVICELVSVLLKIYRQTRNHSLGLSCLSIVSLRLILKKNPNSFDLKKT
jgi:hypothetical protein